MRPDVQGAKVDQKTIRGHTHLHAAHMKGCTEVVCALISGGANVDLLDVLDYSPLHVACFVGYTEVVRALLSAGAKVNLLTGHGLSPLFMACEEGHTEVVCALLSRGAKVDLLARHGDSPLLVACQCGHIGVVRALLSAGARADLRDIHGRTPLDLLPCALRAEVEGLVQQAAEGVSARTDNSQVGAPSAPAVVLPPPHYHQLQVAIEDGGEGSSEGPGGLSAKASSSSGRAAFECVCSMCEGPPSVSASSGSVAKLKACGRCMSVHYCS